MSAWYKEILEKIQINASGIVADLLQQILSSDILTTIYKSNPSALDVDVDNQVKSWFEKIFNPWFSGLTVRLGIDDNLQALTSSEYTEKINRTIQELGVARAYYAQQANDAFISSIKYVALHKAALCEDLARSISESYEKALLRYGNTISGKSIEITDVHDFNGSTPEPLKWNNKEIIVNTIKYENVAVDQQEQPSNEKTTSRVPQYLPWVFTAAFGLIAWSAAAKK
ncbi:MAG: hypothetical protein WBL21_00095 [Salinimicrobium sp.]